VTEAAIGVGCGAAILRDGRILLVQRIKAPEAGCWSLVGGKVDFLERAAKAAQRETLEEVGLKIEAGPLLCLIEMIGIDDQHWISPVYRASAQSGEAVNREPEKIAAIGWFALDAPPTPLSLAACEAIAILRAEAGV
jgi:8-oxo-dGTP diphosphatase